MKPNISILGCGWLGLALAIDLTEKGYLVKGSTTSISKIKTLKENGIDPYLINISEPNDSITEFLTSEVLIIAITTKSVDEVKRFIVQLEASKVQKVLFVSSTSVYPFTNGVITEETPTLSTPLAEIEQLFLRNSSFKTTLIRFGGLFGYDRKPGNFIKSGIVENPEGYVNLIHRDDCIKIMEQIVLKNTWNETLNACADTHPSRRDFYLREITKLGAPAPQYKESSENRFKIIQSEKLKSLLNYEFIHADLMKIE